ncbi:MAG TPA: hypothetical protein VHM70_00055, partial [Polyangiaceae bacterium]|nr:hypothetical protein [Polyangiaceae bacterium]
ARCAKVTCPTGDACVSYPDPVSQQCSSFGQCETTQTYCTPIYKDAGESCGSGLACNGQGACGSVCADNQVWCTSACVDPQTDDAHCGADDNCSGGQACTDGTACEGGVCLVQCSGGDVRCDNTCIDPTSDSTYCGASGSCSGATAGTECSAGACMQSKCRTWKGHSQLWDASSGQGVSVFPTPNGDFLVTYTQYDINTSTQDIWFDRYSASAHSWAGGEHVEDIDLFANGGVAGVDGQGTTFAVWFQNDPNDGPTRIRTASRSNAGWGSSIGLSAQGTISMWPKLSILSNGDAIAAWGQQASTPSDPEHVYFARRTGGAWQNAAAVESQTGISQVQHLAAGGNGTAMVLWVNYPPSSTNSALYASLWSGSSWGTPAKLADDTTTKLYATSAGDSSGNYYVAWSESDSGVHRVKVRRYSASTSTWGTVKTFVDAAGSYVSTAVTNDGIPHITWTDVDTKFTWVSTDPSNGDWLTPLTMGTGYGDAVGARCDSAGNVILLWRDNNVLKWRYKASGASSFASEQPIMDLTGYVFSHAWAMNPDGSAMAGYSFGPGDGSANLGFNPFE